MADDKLTKVHIDLPNHWAIGGESMWAKPIADDRYRLENVPFYAYGLNFHDIVRATADAPDTILEIREVVRPSGHHTFRCFFDAEISREQQLDYFDVLRPFGATVERADERLVALDLEPDGSYNDVYDQLMEWEAASVLSFETCEQRTDGSFDDLPETSEAD